MYSIVYILPEIFLSLSIMFLLMLGVFIKKSFNLVYLLTILSLIFAIALILNQPDEIIKIQYNIKSNREGNKIETIYGEFDHKKHFSSKTPEAYEKLLLDIANSDPTHFTRWDGVEESWKIIDKLVRCKDNCPIIFKYQSGSLGPKQADKLLLKDSRQWNKF